MTMKDPKNADAVGKLLSFALITCSEQNNVIKGLEIRSNWYV